LQYFAYYYHNESALFMQVVFNFLFIKVFDIIYVRLKERKKT